MEALIHYHVADRVATITMNRPEKRNALNADLVFELQGAFAHSAEDDDVRVVVLTGSGRAFSAGADLAAMESIGTAGLEDSLDDSRQLALLFEQIYLLPKPVIARVNGHAIAGGCGLAAVCDFAIAADSARLGFTEVRIGFVPAIVSVFVLRKLGEASARDLLLRGALIEAETAARIGLITRAVPADRLDAEVDDLAAELVAETSGTAVGLTKHLLAHVQGMGLREAVAYAAQVNAFARGTEDCRAGIRAFLDKTSPPWKAG